MKLQTLKNNYAFAYPLLALSLVLGSCSQEEGNNVFPEKDFQHKTITFTVNPITAETQDISTRVTLLPSRNSDGLTWDDGDDVTFYYFTSNFSSEAIKTYSVSVGEESTSISGGYPATTGEYNIYALYPHSAQNFTSDYTYLTMPASVDYDEDLGYLRNAIFLYAQPEGTVSVDASQQTVSGNVELDFNLLSALLRFDIKNESSQDFTLQSVSIGFPEGSDAKLTRQAVLNEAEGSVSQRSGYTHDAQTLNFPDGYELNMGADPLQGYLGIFPTAAATALNIDIAVLLSDGTSHTIELGIENVPVLTAGNRYTIEVAIDDDDLIKTPTTGLGKTEFSGKDHITYTFSKNEITYTWMLEPLTINSSVIYESLPFTSCPALFRHPDDNDLYLLQEEIEKNPSLYDDILNLTPNTLFYSSLGASVKGYGNMYSIFYGERLSVNVNRTLILRGDGSSFISAINADFTNYRGLVRCVKK
jgi:hypothetical protein